MVILQTLEGHDSSVLRAEFISQGMQLVTTGADGLLKLWNISTSECTATFDDHDGRIWALTGLFLMMGENTFVSVVCVLYECWKCV
jgi:FOG: WD40 repeat